MLHGFAYVEGFDLLDGVNSNEFFDPECESAPDLPQNRWGASILPRFDIVVVQSVLMKDVSDEWVTQRAFGV